MKFDLNNKNVLITGATGGIGSKIVEKMSNIGANILVTGTNNEKLIKLTEKFKKNINSIKCDLNNFSDIEFMVEKAKSIFDGKVDVLVNNAGITKDNLALRMKTEEWIDVININLNSTFILTKQILKLMIKNRYGKIINISSIVGTMGNLGQANYSASKAGIESMSRSIALEVAKRNITVNCVAPGFIETKMTEGILENNKENLLKTIPMGRIGNTNDITGIVCFLASDYSSYITGQTIHVNGGMFMS